MVKEIKQALFEMLKFLIGSVIGYIFVHNLP
jgi:hypothetical protein